MALLEELMQAALAAPDERKREAVELLRGTRPATVPAPRGPLLMGMTAAASYLGVSRATLWRMLRDGLLQKVEIFPNCFRLRRSDLDAIAQHSSGTASFSPPCGGAAAQTHNMEKLP
jgi:excisionase family DNA binding protein